MREAVRGGPGPVDGPRSGLVNVNGTLYFAADDGSAGVELWRSDGTSGGTVKLREFTGSMSFLARKLGDRVILQPGAVLGDQVAVAFGLGGGVLVEPLLQGFLLGGVQRILAGEFTGFGVSLALQLTDFEVLF